jgi:urease beta subunit
MRKFLLASAAVTALLAGPAVANAQNAGDMQRGPAASSQQHQKTNARDEKAGGASSAQSMERRQTTGSSHEQASPMGDRAAKSGASEKAAGSDRQERKGAQNAQGMQRDEKANAREKSGPSNKETTGAAQEPRRKGAQEPGQHGKPSAQKSGSPDQKRQTTGAAQGSQGTQGEQHKPGAAPKASSAKENNAKANDQRSTTGQSSSEQRMKGDRGTAGNPANPQGQNRMDHNASPSAKSNEAGSKTTSTSSTSTSNTNSASVNQEQQTKFNQVIEKQKVRSVDNINVNVSVGSSIPRSVHVYDVPRDIVTVYPQYRGKKFVVVRDEIVIMEPGTRKIVSVIPRSGRSTTGTSTSVRHSTSSKLQLAPEQRRTIRETVIKEQAAPRCSELTVSVGEEVPRSLHLQPLPDTLVREVPAIRSYDFCIKNNEVVLIDPNEYRIVEVIE